MVCAKLIGIPNAQAAAEYDIQELDFAKLINRVCISCDNDWRCLLWAGALKRLPDVPTSLASVISVSDLVVAITYCPLTLLDYALDKWVAKYNGAYCYWV